MNTFLNNYLTNKIFSLKKNFNEKSQKYFLNKFRTRLKTLRKRPSLTFFSLSLLSSLLSLKSNSKGPFSVSSTFTGTNDCNSTPF